MENHFRTFLELHFANQKELEKGDISPLESDRERDRYEIPTKKETSVR